MTAIAYVNSRFLDGMSGVMIYDVRNTEVWQVRQRSTERRRYGNRVLKPLDSLPPNASMQGAVLPVEQHGWKLTGPQLWYDKTTVMIQIRHHCGTTRHFARAAWLRGAKLPKQCQGCFKPQKGLGQIMLAGSRGPVLPDPVGRKRQ